MGVFWVKAPRSLVEVYRRFGGAPIFIFSFCVSSVPPGNCGNSSEKFIVFHTFFTVKNSETEVTELTKATHCSS
jgi:hypothetical protein